VIYLFIGWGWGEGNVHIPSQGAPLKQPHWVIQSSMYSNIIIFWNFYSNKNLFKPLPFYPSPYDLPLVTHPSDRNFYSHPYYPQLTLEVSNIDILLYNCASTKCTNTGSNSYYI
jgi:hypothetical protein